MANAAKCWRIQHIYNRSRGNSTTGNRSSKGNRIGSDSRAVCRNDTTNRIDRQARLDIAGIYVGELRVGYGSTCGRSCWHWNKGRIKALAISIGRIVSLDPFNSVSSGSRTDTTIGHSIVVGNVVCTRRASTNVDCTGGCINR